MTNEIGDFLDYLTYERNVSVNTVAAYRDDLESFVGFLCNDYFTLGRDQLDLRRVDHLAVRSYLAHLARRKLRPRLDRAASLGAALVLQVPDARRASSRRIRRAASRRRSARSICRRCCRPSDVALLLEQPDTSTPLGVRDRAWLELLYASGLRIGELVGIDIDDVELRARLVKVRGKGSKERIVPFGSKAEEAMRAWLAVRGSWSRRRRARRCSSTIAAQRITTRSVRRLFDGYVRDAVAARRHLAAHDAPFVRHAPAQRRRRSARHPGAPRPRLAVDDAEVHAPQRLAVDRGVQEGASEGVNMKSEVRAKENGSCPL